MALKEYRRKRQFDRTPEPPGAPSPTPTPGRAGRFVVQKHQARRLHYDFRLEIEGVLKSWAVPKGPSMNPADKRLAMMTEDHPLAYADFEGIIPEGNYGAGSVMVWDQGTFGWSETSSPSEQLARGNLKFFLQGEKLRGSFDLVRLQRGEKGNEWLLIKRRDAHLDPDWDIAAHDGSVLSGRSLDEIAAQAMPRLQTARVEPGALAGAHKAPLPKTLAPMLATLAAEAFSRPEWLFELKWDGVRALAWVREAKLVLRSRTGRDISAQFPELALLPQQLVAGSAILDGEIVVLDARGRGDFESLQERLGVSRPGAAVLRRWPVTYYVFDLLYLDGYDLRKVRLEERKRLLRQALVPQNPIRYCDHQAEKGRELFALARQAGMEGIIGKQARSPYVSGRSPQWRKFKVTQELDAVIGGYTAPRGGRLHFGALLVGLYAGRELVHIGGVGSGFTPKEQERIAARLRRLERKRCPFSQPPETPEPAVWVEPHLVARVRFASWTQERRLRQPVFVGLRRDAQPEDCVLETAPAAAPVPEQPPAIVGQVLRSGQAIERELFRGRADNAILELDGRPLHLSNLNKIYFPEDGYTKRDLLAYYYRIADLLLPYLKERPLVLRRYPDGIHGQAFFQKEVGEDAPEWMPTAEVFSEERGQPTRYFLVGDRAGLLYLVNLGCIDHNPWASRLPDLEHPDYVWFDLDPADDTPFSTVVDVARHLDRTLRALGLQAGIKTSGATGMHLYLPVQPRYSFEQVRTFAEVVARLVAWENPEQVTQERAVAKRSRGKVYIDCFQNARGRPLAAPYVVRAQPRAPVSTPLLPGELRKGLKPERFTLRTVLARLERRGDLWTGLHEQEQQLEQATERLRQRLARERRA